MTFTALYTLAFARDRLYSHDAYEEWRYDSRDYIWRSSGSRSRISNLGTPKKSIHGYTGSPLLFCLSLFLFFNWIVLIVFQHFCMEGFACLSNLSTYHNPILLGLVPVCSRRAPSPLNTGWHWPHLKWIAVLDFRYKFQDWRIMSVDVAYLWVTWHWKFHPVPYVKFHSTRASFPNSNMRVSFFLTSRLISKRMNLLSIRFATTRYLTHAHF